MICIFLGGFLRILVVTPSYFPIVGGSEMLVRTLSIKLNEIGIHTDVMTFNMNEKWNPIWREDIENDGFSTIFKMPALTPFSSFPINPLYPLFRMNVLPKLGFTKKFANYDVIHFAGEADLSFLFLSYTTQKPKIMHCLATHGLHTHYKKHFILKKIFRKFFPRLADKYIVSSSTGLKFLSELGVPLPKILTLPVAVDVDTFHPDKENKLDNLVLFVGRIEKSKGLHILLKALSYLSFKTQVAIIGPRWNMKYFREINTMYRKINGEGIHTVMYLGTMDQAGLLPWYQRATVLVRPDLLGVSGGLTALEALACGTPIIGTGNHVLNNGVNGIIVPPNNPKELAEALHKLLENKELREKYEREGRRIVEQYFSLKPIITRLVKLYENMLSD